MKIKDDDVITKWEWINMTAAFQEKQIKFRDFVDLIEAFGRVQSLLYSEKELNKKNSKDYDEWRKSTQLNKINKKIKAHEKAN
jgi:hypothetical protein